MQVASNALLKTAVHQDNLSSRCGISQRMFSWWFHSFVYNQIWEDPEVDLAALELTPDSRILTIASGGCNVLNYLAANPAAVVAVDLNPYHMYLTRLKLACLQHLPDHESFFNFFGHANHHDNLEKYKTFVSPHLDDVTRAYWESDNWLRRKRGKSRIHYFTENFYRYARSGYFLRFLHALGRVAKVDFSKLLTAQTLAEQEKIFAEEIAPLFDKWAIRKLCNWSFSVFSLGIPPQQCHAMREEGDGQLAEVYKQRVKRLACGFPMNENYFAWQSFGLRYDHENRMAVPNYLKAENYDLIKTNATRVETQITTLGDYLGHQPDNSMDRFVLLDSQDWMKPHVIQALWAEIARVGKPGARIIFRTAASISPIETALSADLRARFEYLSETSKTLHARDRSAIYGGFHIYVMK
jgi:S-adenosylmethionine-diacylglycerol 3-amino-3-carboxypropyl transferase